MASARTKRREGRASRPRESSGEDLRLRVGPEHPITRGSLQLRLDLEGETVHDLEVRIGHTHRGFEKQCEASPWLHVVAHAERLNFQSPVFASSAVCMAIETLMEIECPRRAQWLRVLAAELYRAGDHLARVQRVASQLAVESAAGLLLTAREHMMSLIDRLCGARVTSSYVCVGGVRHDLPDDFESACEEHFEATRILLDDIEALTSRSQWVRDRLEGVAVLSREDCIRDSVTGPLLRAAGEPLDLRRDMPYLSYADLDFDVPVGSVGDNLDRLLVCFAEIRQSLAIVELTLDRLTGVGPGALRAEDERLEVARPGLSTEQDSNRELATLQVPEGKVYQAVESPNGELGILLVSDGSQRPARVRCRPPSLLNLQPFSHMMEGQAFADLGVTFALINAVDGEFDR